MVTLDRVIVALIFLVGIKSKHIVLLWMRLNCARPVLPSVECVHEQLGSAVCIAPVRLAVTWLLRNPTSVWERVGNGGMKSVSTMGMDMVVVVSGRAVVDDPE
jgi:hypothetical protein